MTRAARSPLALVVALALALSLPGAAAAQELPPFDEPAQPSPALRDDAPAAAPSAQAPTAQAPAAQAPSATPADDQSVGRTGREIDALLGGLTDGSPAQRQRAADAFVAAIERDDVPAIQQRLMAPLRGVSVDPMRLRVVRIVNQATAGRPNAEYDLLALLLAAPRSRETDVAVERITMARALGRVQTPDAGRALLAFAGAFNGAFRQEVGRIIRGQLRDYVIPAIIEARALSEMQRIFVRQLRESLHRVTPGETVQQHDNALLAEILRAYGSTRQADAMKVVISFVNTDRAQVREAARWAVSQYARDAIHALRDAYEMYEGHDPDLAWGWERVARELYAANDRRRDAEVAQRLDQGLAAGRAHEVDAMMGHFRYVLARHPTFDRRREMVPLLVENARRLEGRDAAKAEALWRLALWVDPAGAQVRQIRGAILFLEAERSLQRGVADPELYRAVLRVDPSNERARDQLESVEQTGVLRARRRIRLLGAAALLALALGGLWALLRLPASRRPRRPQPPARREEAEARATDTTPDAPPAGDRRDDATRAHDAAPYQSVGA